MTAFATLGLEEEKAVWERFSEAFGLEGRPMREPVPFVVYQLDVDALWWQEPPSCEWQSNPALEADFYAKMLSAFRSCLRPEEFLYALDEQHQCYRFWPHRLQHGESWKLPLIPDGDYSHFVSEDFRLGMLGYLYGGSGETADEPAICVFGEELVALVRADPPAIVTRIVRQTSGWPQST